MRTLKICNTDISAFSIVLKADPDPAEKTAAEFLQRVIKASCGVEVPTVAENAANGIYLGFRAPGESVRFDGFRIAADEVLSVVSGLHVETVVLKLQGVSDGTCT